MKKSLAFLGIALATLVSCTNDEVTEVAQNRAIRFDSFVNNGTRADVTTNNLAKFYVFGKYNSDQSNWVDVFKNVEVNKPTQGTNWTPVQVAYWEPKKSYNFGAYADGDASLTSVSFASSSASEASLTFTGYKAGDKDLIAAIAKNQTYAGTGEPSAVSLTFKHMLSKVKFTFKTISAETYGLAVSDLKIVGDDKAAEAQKGAIITATGAYKGTESNDPTWTTNSNVTHGNYEYAAINDYADGKFSNGQPVGVSVEKYVIPQSNETLTATFTITPTNQAGTKGKAVTYTTTLKIANNTTWASGMVYNYTATIDYDKVIDDGTETQDDKPKPIEFTPTVSDWGTETDQEVTPTPQTQPKP